jgi:hypothetical protein
MDLSFFVKGFIYAIVGIIVYESMFYRRQHLIPKNYFWFTHWFWPLILVSLIIEYCTQISKDFYKVEVQSEICKYCKFKLNETACTGRACVNRRCVCGDTMMDGGCGLAGCAKIRAAI